MTILWDLKGFYVIKWRTVRDSNSRYPYEYASLAGMWFQPAHPTVRVFVE